MAPFLGIHDDPVQRTALYRAWLREGINDGDLLALRAHLHQQRALGSPAFQAMIERTSAVPPRYARGAGLD